MKAKAVFLDRDGVINEYPGDFQYVTSVEQFHLLPGVGSALKKLHEGGFLLFVVSNQAGVGKGLYTQAQLDRITDAMVTELAAQGAPLRKVYYCMHLPEENCVCRKPKTGMVEAAVDELMMQGIEIDKSSSYFIGDSMRDIETGKASALKTILVFSGKEKPENRPQWTAVPDFVAADVREAVYCILLRTRSRPKET